MDCRVAEGRPGPFPWFDFVAVKLPRDLARHRGSTWKWAGGEKSLVRLARSQRARLASSVSHEPSPSPNIS